MGWVSLRCHLWGFAGLVGLACGGCWASAECAVWYEVSVVAVGWLLCGAGAVFCGVFAGGDGCCDAVCLLEECCVAQFGVGSFS